MIIPLKPKVTLFTHTDNPLSAIAVAIDIWHAKSEDIPSQAYAIPWTIDELVDKFKWLLKQPHQTPFEFFNMVWVFKNVSRAFQQQLTRHRIASYSIQSLRVVEQEDFASKGRYHIPNTVQDRGAYHDGMLRAQIDYNYAIKNGESVEDARGLLPLNIHSPITMSISYRALIGLMRQRMCVAAQEEWRAVVCQMRHALEEIHPVLVEPIDCMCSRFKVGKAICKTTHEPVTAES